MNIFETMGSMEPISIGLWVTGSILVFVIIGVRVAFAAALAGFLGLVWIFSAKLGFEKGFLVAVKNGRYHSSFQGVYTGAFVILCMALYKGMRWTELKNSLMETARLTVMIFTIIWGVLLYVRFLGFADLPSAFSDWITSLDQSPMLTFLLILCAYAVLGMFMDAIGYNSADKV
jgi:TRAP-type C4-dicarboxylate transport system permease large subunit